VNEAYTAEDVIERCARCDRTVDEAPVLSTHHTSEGWVRYRRCPCGSVSIQLVQLTPGPDLHSDLLTSA
jgi:hypothetical protein